MKPLPTAHPAPDETPAAHPRECLSALADGQAHAMQSGLNLWREDEQARRAWHTWHLIGDVMRSDELAARPAHDAAFLAGVRARLAVEPVVLAPQAVVPRRRQSWLMPAAAAAGVAVVAGVLVVARVGLPGAPQPDALQATAPGAAAGGQTVSVDGQGVLRDARLEELVRHHRGSRGGITVPGPGALRSQAAIPVSAER